MYLGTCLGWAAYVGLWGLALWFIGAVDFVSFEGRRPPAPLAVAAALSCLAAVGLNPPALALMVLRKRRVERRTHPVVLRAAEFKLLFGRPVPPHSLFRGKPKELPLEERLLP